MSKWLIVLGVMIGLASIGAQTPLGREAIELRSHAAMQALDRYLETWNSRDARRWATSLHFPHIRPGPGVFELSKTPEEYVAGVNFQQTLSTGWHHSEWVARRVLQIGTDKVHVAGEWQRYTAEGRPLTGSVITYVVTLESGRWGVLSRFAAGPTGIGAADLERNSEAARAAVEAYFLAVNGHDPQAFVKVLHFPHVRIDADGSVEVSMAEAEFLGGSEPGRQRTWYETRLDRADIVQVSANGVNVSVVYSRRDRSGAVLSQYEALLLAVRRGDQWRIQAISTMGT